MTGAGTGQDMRRDHGGGVDDAAARWGGDRGDWIDLSTGINPQPYPLPQLAPDIWTALPDAGLTRSCIAAARRFWSVPQAAAILPVPGLSAAIARMPGLTDAPAVAIPGPTYNEHAAAFRTAGRTVLAQPGAMAPAQVVVHPNNPDGRRSDAGSVLAAHSRLTVIDESFCDTCPDDSLTGLADRPGIVVLKSFGKFWGLAGLRLGFVIGLPQTLAALADLLGPWPVSGPALAVGAAALDDAAWARATRARLDRDARRLDALALAAGARSVGGTTLFRLYEVGDAPAWQDRLARRRIWSRVFPYAPGWLRLGLPPGNGWDRLETALSGR